jgi:uncharacterized membrane protein
MKISSPQPLMPSSTEVPMAEETAQSGLSENAAGALAYVTVIPAIIFLLVEPYNKNPYIKFHAWQSVFFSIACVGLWVLDIILAMIPIIGWIAMAIIGLGVIVLWIVLVMKALSGNKFMLPVIGALAEKQANS